MITFGRTCNMIGEINKRKNDYEASIKYYLRGISQEPAFIDNYLDLAELCEQINEPQISQIYYIFANILQILNEMNSLENQPPLSLKFSEEDQKILGEAVRQLQERIRERKIAFHFLRTITVLQRLIEKYMKEVQKMN